MSGLCECGCGKQTRIAPQTHARYGWVRGVPLRFVCGHNQRMNKANGYLEVGTGTNKKQVHRLRAERALGRPLPIGAEVHHVDGDISSPSARLVICQDSAYHKLLHRRARIVKAGGNPQTQQLCRTCHGVKYLADFAVNNTSPSGRHWECRSCRSVSRKRWAASKQEAIA